MDLVKKEEMKLTFRDVSDYFGSIQKLLAVTEIQNWEDSLKIAQLKNPVDKIVLLYSTGRNAIEFKYEKLKEKNKSALNPKGYNTADEQEKKEEEFMALHKKSIGVEIKFESLSKDTVQSLFKKPEEPKEDDSEDCKVVEKKENLFNHNDLGAFVYLGLVK